MTNPPLLVTAIICAFLMGYTVNQGSTCAVAAGKELVFKRQGSILTGFAVAMGTAGLACLPLAWLAGDAGHLAADGAITPALLVGAILLGVGAVVNDACLFGTLSRIGHGELRFLALPIGLGLGFAVADRQTVLHAPRPLPNPFASPSPEAAAVIVLFGLLLGLAWFALARDAKPARLGDWPLRRAMVLLGVCGAILFTLAPGWTYADAVRRAVAPGGTMMSIGIEPLLAALAVLAGALVSGLRSRMFIYRRLTTKGVLRSLCGGAIMAIGASLIPGGNDKLLLSSVPTATGSGMVAYLVMSLTVPLLLFSLQKRSSSRRA
jgi:uncharacterized protein